MHYIEYEEKGHVGILTVKRPEALNALNSALISELSAKLNQINVADIRCLILTGFGNKAFVAGADIREMKDLSVREAEQFSLNGNKMMEKIERLSIPVIAAVNGFALGGGCELALACDIRLAAENAVFAFPEVSLGILPGYGGIQRLIRTVGSAKAKELVFTADRVNAAEAYTMGLVNYVCPSNELMNAALAMANKIAANAPVAVCAAKKVANDSIGLTLGEATYLEVALFGKCFATWDQKQAMEAFLEKRNHEPFKGE